MKVSHPASKALRPVRAEATPLPQALIRVLSDQIETPDRRSLYITARGRPTVRIDLSPKERETLQRWARRYSSSQALALRARIVLASAEGLTEREVSKELNLG